MEFTFVLGDDREGVRSQAMRAHWRQRRQDSEHKKQRKNLKQRQLLPSAAEGTGDRDHHSLEGSHEPMEELEFSFEQRFQPTSSDKRPETHSIADGIPSQALSGMNRALASSRIDPFDTFPLKLTAQHHKLLHHWLTTHATMMFDDLPMATFNPMRDVWFPLDLSNASSFNTIMAHSAAHLARMQGLKTSKDALRFKSEAVRILMEWVNDPAAALHDEVFAAVVRLLTYERYWGTEAGWRIHRNGLQNMIEARGGIATLQDNWRLELVTFLITLMSKPSWFDSSNEISQLANPQLLDEGHPILGTTQNLHRIRCLWLISFVQDLRTFISHTPELEHNGLAPYQAVHDAVLLLKKDLRKDKKSPSEDGSCQNREFTRLACLFFICVLLQDSQTRQSPSPGHQITPGDDTAPQMRKRLSFLNSFLDESRCTWTDNLNGLYDNLFHYFSTPIGKAHEANYVLNMTHVLGSMSCEARRGVEKCLLQILCRDHDDGQDFDFEDDSTPDSLLSSLHGL